MARSNAPKIDFSTQNAKSEKTMSTALAVAQEKLGSGSAAKYNAIKSNAELKWQAEKLFAMQIIRSATSDLLPETVINNPLSLLVAMQSAASLGLTLDPTQALAYLIPKRPKAGMPYEVQLKVSYKGMEQAVLRSGTVTAITTELVYSNDTFEFGTSIDGPYLNFRAARGDRGDLDGCFCLARYANGERHVEWMPRADIDACEAAATKANNGTTPPSWAGGFRPEMQKKCCVRRSAKHWPATPVLTRLIHEFDVENPMDFDGPALVGESVELLGDNHVDQLRQLLHELPEPQVAMWLQMKAKAEGYDSIRDVPVSAFEKVREGLEQRLKLVMEKRATKEHKEDGE